MKFEDLKKFIDIEEERLKKCYVYPEKDKRILAHAVKLGEEVGELYDEVLAKIGLQRKEKAGEYSDESLAEECADIFIVTMLLANSLNINVENALIKKIEKIEERHKNNNC